MKKSMTFKYCKANYLQFLRSTLHKDQFFFVILNFTLAFNKFVEFRIMANDKS